MPIITALHNETIRWQGWTAGDTTYWRPARDDLNKLMITCCGAKWSWSMPFIISIQVMASCWAIFITLASLVGFNGPQSYILAGTVVPGRWNLARQVRGEISDKGCSVILQVGKVAHGDNHTIPENTSYYRNLNLKFTTHNFYGNSIFFSFQFIDYPLIIINNQLLIVDYSLITHKMSVIIN